MNSARYQVEIGNEAFVQNANNCQVVFHGINKSGSLSMANVLHESFEHAGRSSEFLCHYFGGGPSPAFAKKAEGPFRLVVGHDLFGALKPKPKRVWVTQFRHPLPRVLSAYNWLRNKSQDGSYPSLAKFVEKTEGISHSQLVQFGVGFGPNKLARRRAGLTPKNLLEISVDNITAHVYALGIAERFEESIFTFAGLCGLDSLAPWVRDVRNPGRPLSSEISDHDRELIEDVFAYDYELYRWALERFENQCKSLRFSEELRHYTDACADQYNDRILL